MRNNPSRVSKLESHPCKSRRKVSHADLLKQVDSTKKIAELRREQEMECRHNAAKHVALASVRRAVDDFSNLTKEKFVDALHRIIARYPRASCRAYRPLGRQRGLQFLPELYLATDGAMIVAPTDANLNAIVLTWRC